MSHRPSPTRKSAKAGGAAAPPGNDRGRTMKILVIEDDLKTGNYLKSGLRESGYAVDLARTGTDGLHMALANDYDLVVLDAMLPGIDGWQIMPTLREKRDLRVLFLTARDQLNDRIRGLELGADDYLVKPFSFTELVLRIRTLLRRGAAREAEFHEFADLKLDVLRRKVTRNGTEIALTNKEFLLLHLLIKRQGEALSRTLIASEVWNMNFDSDTNVVDVAIKRLRAKVDQPFEKRLIHTVRSVGYAFGDPT
jgi:two-component system copper resistance phosphate regulon response regulator CusR